MAVWRRGREFAETPFRGGGQVGLDNHEVGEAVEGAPASAGAALLDLDPADVTFGLVKCGRPKSVVIVDVPAVGEPSVDVQAGR